jgi:hypothetical protein
LQNGFIHRSLTFLLLAVATFKLCADVQLLASSWRYEQTSNLDGVNWQSPDFNDGAWPAGNALLYVETNSMVTPRNTPLTIGRTTYYFRTRFSFPFEPTNVALMFSARIDDGAVSI